MNVKRAIVLGKKGKICKNKDDMSLFIDSRGIVKRTEYDQETGREIAAIEAHKYPTEDWFVDPEYCNENCARCKLECLRNSMGRLPLTVIISRSKCQKSADFLKERVIRFLKEDLFPLVEAADKGYTKRLKVVIKTTEKIADFFLDFTVAEDVQVNE